MEPRPAALDPETLGPEPLAALRRWLADAGAERLDEVAMTLATATRDGRPSARIVLLRGLDTGLVFFTSYASRKGDELESNPRAAAVLHWPAAHRQVRIEGPVERVSPAESDAYFVQRPPGHRLSAIASPQSRVVRDRRELEAAVAALLERYRHAPPPRPADWGGYRLLPDCVEFWQGRPHRLHDRLRYRRTPEGPWRIERLAP